MIWQDIVISIVVVLFSYALIPQIVYGFKNKKPTITFQTAIITSLGMYIIAITYLTIDLIFSTIMCLITGTLWLLLLIQRVIYN